MTGTILKLASAGLIGATVLGSGMSAIAAPMGYRTKSGCRRFLARHRCPVAPVGRRLGLSPRLGRWLGVGRACDRRRNRPRRPRRGRGGQHAVLLRLSRLRLWLRLRLSRLLLRLPVLRSSGGALREPLFISPRPSGRACRARPAGCRQPPSDRRPRRALLVRRPGR